MTSQYSLFSHGGCPVVHWSLQCDWPVFTGPVSPIHCQALAPLPLVLTTKLGRKSAFWGWVDTGAQCPSSGSPALSSLPCKQLWALSLISLSLTLSCLLSFSHTLSLPFFLFLFLSFSFFIDFSFSLALSLLLSLSSLLSLSFSCFLSP